MNIGKVPAVRTNGNETIVSAGKKEKPQADEAKQVQSGDAEVSGRRKTKHAEEGKPQGQAADRVVISKDALARLAAMADAARADGITEAAPEVDEGIRIEKVRLARERMRSGYYDRPEIQEQIADRLANELRRRPPDEPEGPEQK